MLCQEVLMGVTGDAGTGNGAPTGAAARAAPLQRLRNFEVGTWWARWPPWPKCAMDGQWAAEPAGGSWPCADFRSLLQRWGRSLLVAVLALAVGSTAVRIINACVAWQRCTLMASYGQHAEALLQ